jgi:DNA-binding MarR family transcriptional regulator/GNAT superfamily N-acetyltransferase
MPSKTGQIAAVRAFNRFYTRVIGLLEEGMHHSPHTLAEARLIYEIGRRTTATAAIIAEELGMDRGQLSRLVWRLMDQGLIASLPRGNDRRAAPMALTPEGEATFAALNELSDKAAAETLLDPLDEFRRQDLVSAMRRIEVLLGHKRDDVLVLRPPRVGEIGWLIHRQGLLYHLELGWNAEFETLIAGIYRDFQLAPDSPAKSLWVAEQGGEVAGSVFVIPAENGEPDTAQLRMLYVEPMFRGHGIGRRLVDEAVRFARASGYRRLILWTQDCLISARRIYQAAGFELVSEERHHSFGVDLNGQFWALDLS